jgi:hypothetical protein
MTAVADDLRYADLRPLFDELHDVTESARAAISEGNMQAWLEYAGRGAELHELIAIRLGWREVRRG